MCLNRCTLIYVLSLYSNIVISAWNTYGINFLSSSCGRWLRSSLEIETMLLIYNLCSKALKESSIRQNLWIFTQCKLRAQHPPKAQCYIGLHSISPLCSHGCISNLTGIELQCYSCLKCKHLLLHASLVFTCS